MGFVICHMGFINKGLGFPIIFISFWLCCGEVMFNGGGRGSTWGALDWDLRSVRGPRFLEGKTSRISGR